MNYTDKGPLQQQIGRIIMNPVFIVSVILIILFDICFVVNTWQISIKATEYEAVQLALAAESSFQKSLLSKLNTDINDIEREEYKEIKHNLIDLGNINRNIRSTYIYTQENGRIYILASSDLSDSKEYLPLGQEYGEANEQFYLPFQNGQVLVTKPITDSWGKWISVLVPMKDTETDDIIAVLGMNYPEDLWDDHAVVRTIQSSIVAFFALLIFIIFYIAFVQNKELREEKKKLLELSEKLKDSEKLFRTVFDQAPIGIALAHNDKYISFYNDDKPSVNSMFEKITGRRKEEFKNISWIDITHPDDLDEDLEMFEKMKSGEINSYDMEKRYIKPDGSEVWIHMNIVPLRFNGNTYYSHLCLIEDISERKKIEKALYDSERSKAVLLDNLPGMAYRCNYDRNWTMQFVSAGCFELTGYQPDSLLYNRELSFNDLIAPEYREGLWNEWANVLAKQLPFRHEYEIISAGGKRKWVLEMGQGIYDKTGAVEAIEGIIIDITDRKEREAEIQYINDHDYVSGLYNRRYFEEEMKRLDNKDCLPLSILIADINGLRLINDTLGYSEGDKLIVESSKILQSCCRKGDVLARIGGDEFGILMPNTDSDTAHKMLKKIIESCVAYNENNKSKLYEISVSIGYATKETVEEKIEETAKIADEYLRNRKLLNRKSFHSNIISSMMATVYEKSQETEEHAKRLAKLSRMVGEKLNISRKSLGDLELFAMLHDIGKVGIDDRVLNKPGKLSEEEWAIMKKHPEIGYRIVKSSSELEHIAEYILTHHERWDGKGYPGGLKGEEIPLLSRIIAVVDAYDAMTQDRVYRKAMTKEQAIEEIKKNAGTQFDPEIVIIFVESI